MGTTKDDLEHAGFKLTYWQPPGHPTPPWHFRVEGQTDYGDHIVAEVDDDDLSRGPDRAWALAIEKYDASNKETVRDRKRKREERNAGKGRR
jgi:hypothetical protein